MDFREEGWGLRYRLLKVVPCKGNLGHSSLKEGGGVGISKKWAGV